MKVKVNEAEREVLDWMVAKCEGRGIEFDDPSDPWLTRDGIADQPLHSYNPSTDWSQGGPIIEREKIGVLMSDSGWQAGKAWEFFESNSYAYHREYGPTPLIAAMRCYVASKLGDEVDVPEELQ